MATKSQEPEVAAFIKIKKKKIFNDSTNGSKAFWVSLLQQCLDYWTSNVLQWFGTSTIVMDITLIHPRNTLVVHWLISQRHILNGLLAIMATALVLFMALEATYLIKWSRISGYTDKVMLLQYFWIYL